MNAELLDIFFGKRFSGLLICTGALFAGFMWGEPAAFPSLATSISLMYGVYVGGQSYTDANKS